jgi:hypothetical protein
MAGRVKQGTTRSDLNEIKEVISLEVKLSIKEAVEPLAKQININTQELFGVGGNGGLKAKVEATSRDFGDLRDEFREEKAKLNGVAAVLSAIGAAVGVGASFVAKAFMGPK